MHTLDMFTIYERPLDYPNDFVVRRFEIANGKPKPAELVGLAKSLEEARKLLPRGLYNLRRLAGDEPQIVETWI